MNPHDHLSFRATNQPRRGGRASNVRWIVLAIVAFASTSAYLTRYCVAAANTTIQGELGLNDAQMGNIIGAFALGYLFFQVPGGWLGNRFGTRFAFAFISTVWSLCNVWSGVVSSFWALWASRLGLGVFQAGLAPISAKILKDWIPLKHRGMSSATIGACMSIGGALTMLLTGQLLSDEYGYGWRTIFFAYSLVGIIWAAGFCWFFRTYPEEHALVNEAELRLIHPPEVEPPTEDVEEEIEPTDAEPVSGTTALLASPSMWGLCVQSFFRAAGYAFFVTWFFAFLEYRYGIDKDEAGLLNSLPLFAVVLGTLIGGGIVDALLYGTGSKWVSRNSTALVALTLSGLLTLASASMSSALQFSVVIATGAFFSGIGSPAAWAATIDLGGRHTAVVMGIMNMAGCVAGVVLPIILGNWFDTIRNTEGGDWNPVIYLHAAFYFAGAAAWLFVNPNRVLLR